MDRHIADVVEHMKEYLVFRGAEYAYIVIPCSNNEEKIEVYVNPEHKETVSSVYSVTKTFVGLCVADDVMKGFFSPKDISKSLNPLITLCFGFSPDKMSWFEHESYRSLEPGLIHYMNHVSGIVTCMDPKEVLDTEDERVYKNTCGQPGLFDMGNQWTGSGQSCLGDELNGVVHGINFNMRKRNVFSYNNYGSMIAAYFYTVKRAIWKARLHGKDRLEYVQIHEIAKEKGLFGNPPEEVTWTTRKERTHENLFSTGHMGIQMCGAQMYRIAKHWYEKHHKLLEFVLNSEFGVNASEDNVTIGQTGQTVSRANRYSFGMWLPQIPDKRYVTAIGMRGQYMLIDLDSGLIAIRLYFNKFETKNLHQTFPEDVSLFQNTVNALCQIGTAAEKDAIVANFKAALSINK